MCNWKPVEERQKETKGIPEKIMAKDFPRTMKDIKTQIHAQRTPSRIQHTHALVCLAIFKLRKSKIKSWKQAENKTHYI